SHLNINTQEIVLLFSEFLCPECEICHDWIKRGMLLFILCRPSTLQRTHIPKKIIQEFCYSFIVQRISYISILIKCFCNIRNDEADWCWDAAQFTHDWSECFVCADAAEHATAVCHGAERFFLVLWHKRVDRILYCATKTMIIFWRDKDEAVGLHE